MDSEQHPAEWQQKQEHVTDFYGAWQYLTAVFLASSTPENTEAALTFARQQSERWDEEERVRVLNAMIDGSLNVMCFQPDFIANMRAHRVRMMNEKDGISEPLPEDQDA